MKTWKPITPPPDITGSGFWVGVAGYSYDDWVDRFNPPEKKTAESEKDLERFRFYQRYFSFVEINRTFNEEPSFDFFDELEKNSKVEMRFAVRVHRDISHTDNWDPVPKIDLMHRLMSAVVPIVETGKFYSFLIQLEDRVPTTAHDPHKSGRRPHRRWATRSPLRRGGLGPPTGGGARLGLSG